MATLDQRLLDLPIKKKLYLIMGLLIGNIVFVICLGTFALSTLSSIRASVAGEDLWAKSVKAAIYSLGKYALSQDSKAWEGYQEALKVPLAYDRANKELLKASPDRAVVDEALAAGGIQPDDVAGVDRLFVHFQGVPHVGEAFAAWGEAQVLVEELQVVAREMKSSSGELAGYVPRIDDLNDRITAKEIQFSNALGQASRWASNLFLWLMIGGSLFVSSLTVSLALYLGGRIAEGVGTISTAASRAAKGDLSVRVAVDSKDELGRLADAFNHMTEGLGRLDVLKTEFFANVSHEFRTPLTLMLGPLEDLLPRASPEERQSLEIIHRNSLRLLKLVNSLLDFSRLEAGRMKAHYEATDLSAFTTELASHFTAAVEGAGLTFVVECSPPAQPVRVDRDMWEKIVFNLLSNALKFTFEGSIALTLRYDAAGAELAVTDTGGGIADAHLPQLFERFHRIHGARSRTHEGSGIGLSLVRELVRLHGGTIDVRSREGKGSTFTVRVPFGRADDSSAAAADRDAAGADARRTERAFVQEASLWGPDREPPALATTAGRPRILVVDDNADMRSHVARLLGSQWDVELASDGVDALARIERRRPDLVLSDIMMPRMNGFELLDRLRRDPATNRLPIVLLSARAGEESRAEGIEEGADDYLVKPFSARELLARVNTHLHLSRAREQAVAHDVLVSRLEAERRWLESALDLMPIPLIVLEPDQARITFANRAADVMAGGAFLKDVSLEEHARAFALTDNRGRAIPPEDLPTLRAARGEKVERELVVWPTAAGDLTILVTADALVEMHGHPKTVLVALHDVTALSKAIEARDEFLSIASHELRTPLTSMSLQLQLARRELKPDLGIVPSPERIGKLLNTFHLQTERLTHLVENLLDVSQIQAGRLNLVLESCNLSELVVQTVELHSAVLAAARCPVELDVVEGVVGVCDRKRIEQVITNLIGNAAKYAPGKPVRISLEATDGCASLSVRDEGPGIAREAQDRLFLRYERAVLPRNTSSGLGLGLFISRQIVGAHRGTLGLSSEPGHGALFTVKLPLQAQDRGAA